MGNQIIFNVLTDLVEGIPKSPNAYAYIIANSWRTSEAGARELFHEACSVARKHGEPIPDMQALQAVTFFHASDTVFIQAARNTASVLELVEYGEYVPRYGPRKGKVTKTVTLQLPDYQQPKEASK